MISDTPCGLCRRVFYKSKYEPHVLFYQDNVLIPEFKKVTPHVYVNDLNPSVSAPVRTLGDFVKWPYRLFRDIFMPQLKIRKILNIIEPDMIHSGNGYAALHEWMLACYLNKIKFIAHDRGTRYPCSMRTKFFVRFLDATISVSNAYMENLTRQNLKVKRIRRVYNGLDVEQMVAQNVGFDRNKLKAEFNISENGPIIGILGNIDRWKGQLVVLLAVNSVKKIYPNIKCLIVGPVCGGSEPYNAQLDIYINENNLSETVIFFGYRKDVPNILSILDILIHASIEPEPFGRVILEGMAAGKPIIGTNSGGTPEQIVDGETGILVPMNDDEGMAQAMLFYLNDMKRAKVMGEHETQRLIEMFGIKRMVVETEKVYEEIFPVKKEESIPVSCPRQ